MKKNVKNMVLLAVVGLAMPLMTVPSMAQKGQFGAVLLDGLSSKGVNGFSADHRAISCNIPDDARGVTLREVPDENAEPTGGLGRFNRFTANMRVRKDGWVFVLTTNDLEFNDKGEWDGRRKRRVEKGWVQIEYVCDYRLIRKKRN